MTVDYKKRAAARKAQMEVLEEVKPSTSDKSRVQVCVSLTPEDKATLQSYAKSHGATVSGIITKWIHEQLS